jgi:glycosyltransferase involved in cell wall biosynthesis
MLVGSLRPDFDSWLTATSRRVDVVFAHRPEPTMRYLASIRTHIPRARIVYYGHDLHYRRLAAQAELEDSARLRAASEASYRIESALWQQVDTSVYFAQEEVDEVQARFPACDARLVQPYCLEPAAARPVAAEASLIFVAGFGHPPNVDAAQWLVNEIMPRVWAQLPAARLSLVGSKPTDAVKALAGPRVEVTGWVTDERLAQLYATHRVAVVPLRFGAGVKHKVVEALAAGLPLVTTSIGAQGLADLEAVCRVRDSAEDLADQLIACLRDEALCADLGHLGQDYIAAHFSFESLVRQHHDLLGARAGALAVDDPVSQPAALAA